MKKTRRIAFALCIILLAVMLVFISCEDMDAKAGFDIFDEGVETIEKISTKNGVDTYEITFSDETTRTIKITTNEQDPVSVTGASVNSDGELVLTFSNDTTVNVGKVIGEKGDKGDKGDAGLGISEIKIKNGKLIVVYTDDTEVDLGNVGPQGPKGEDGVGIKEVKIVDNEMIIVYTNNTSKNLGSITSTTEWNTIYEEYKASNPGYTKTQTEWMAEIVEKALYVPEYTVTFNTGNSGISVSSQTIKKGDKVAIPNVNMNRDGLVFQGWYINDEKWSFIGYTVTESITLTAKWIPVPSYTVTFDTGNTGISVPSQTVQFGNTASAPTKNMTREGYTFLGWYLNGAKWSFNTPVTGNITLVAKWEEIALPSQMNVLVTRYGTTANAPWGQMELNPASFGDAINQAHLDRQALILDTYGVTVNYVEARDNQNVSSDIITAMTSKDVTYEIAYPRAQEGQSLVSYLYDMNQSEYLDFAQPYFNQSAYEAFTVCDRTLFAAGDMDFMDNQVAYMLFVNRDLLNDIQEGLSSQLYTRIKNGTWTYDNLRNLSKQVKGNIGDPEQGDEDIYGYGTKSVHRFFAYAGIKEADVDPDTGMYRVALGLDMEKVDTVIANIIEFNTGTDWARTTWGGLWGSNATLAFTEGRVLFYEDVAQQIDNFGSIDFALGVVPFPKLNEEQENYALPVTNVQATLACIPKCTFDRTASEILLDALAKTGSETIMEAYYEKFEAKLDLETIDEDMDIVKNHIMDNIMYDAGNLTCGWSGFLEDVKYDSYANNTNNFTQVFGEAQEQAEIIISAWNSAWGSYNEETE